MKSSSVPSPGPRRTSARLAAGLAGLAGLAAMTLAGSAVDNTPTSYDAADGVVRTNFLATCTGRIPNAPTTVLLASDDACSCAFNVFQSQVPYNGDDRQPSYPADSPTFEELENELPSDPGKFNSLPAGVKDAINSCKAQTTPTTAAGTAGPVAPIGPGVTTTTVAGGTTTGTSAP